MLPAEGRPPHPLRRSLPPPGGGDDARPARSVRRARPRSHARRRALAHVLAGAGGQHAGHVRGGRGRAQSVPEIPPKPGELRTELLGLKERSSEVQTSQQ
ncbi:uncharacterized protein LOC130248587 isoform X1 [Oenanthe melanoleuca]|uniref:uncharacterized protein LOC130248587 isoform X1 n=1 Tax=Oenanthe melanoleuca TaxID=2939378 RepID=UPI0024C17B70|nr:uncharacterized protein LOC130248587 isoform X1 [Oenanthe melanoleuca]